MIKQILISLFILTLYSCSTQEELTLPTLPNAVQASDTEEATDTDESSPTDQESEVVPSSTTEIPVVDQYILTVTADDGGSVTDGGTYDKGTSVTITATPNEGYEFLGWEGSDSLENLLTLSIEQNQTLNAIFQIIIVQFKVDVSAGEGGTVSTDGGTYDDGTEINITAIPNEGFKFVEWEGSGLNESSLNLLIDSNITLIAKFENIPLLSLDDENLLFLSLLKLNIIQNKIISECTFSSKFNNYTFYTDLNQNFLDQRIIVFTLNNPDLRGWLDTSDYLLFWFNNDDNLKLIQVYRNNSVIQSFDINSDEISKLNLLVQFLDSDSFFSQTKSTAEISFQIEDGIYMFTNYGKRISNNDGNERFKCENFVTWSMFNNLNEKGEEYFKILNGVVTDRVVIFPSDLTKRNIVWSFNDWYYTDAYTNKTREIISAGNYEIDNYSQVNLNLQNSILLIENDQIEGFKAAKVLKKVKIQDIGTNIIDSYEGIGFYADEIYSKIDFDDPKTYLTAFIQDAARNNKDLSYVDLNNFEFTIIPDNDWSGPSNAYASRSCFDNQIDITFKESVWQEGKIPFKTSIPDAVKIMWHELGHDILNLDHLCLGDHIMSGRHQEPKIVYSSADCETEYITLYGMDWDNIDQSKNFQRAVSDMFKGTEQIPFDCKTWKGRIIY